MNTKPIIVPFDDIKGKNTIEIDQIIYFNNHDLFISLEFPDYELKYGQDYIYIRSTMVDERRTRTYSFTEGRESPYWDNFHADKNFYYNRNPDPKFASMTYRDDYSIGITYYEER